MPDTFNFGQPLPEPKYDVCKIDSDELLNQGEFFVLRKQDTLAIHALWAYVQVLILAHELTKNHELSEMADSIANLAYSWQDQSDKKLPD